MTDEPAGPHVLFELGMFTGTEPDRHAGAAYATETGAPCRQLSRFRRLKAGADRTDDQSPVHDLQLPSV